MIRLLKAFANERVFFLLGLLNKRLNLKVVRVKIWQSSPEAGISGKVVSNMK